MGDDLIRRLITLRLRSNQPTLLHVKKITDASIKHIYTWTKIIKNINPWNEELNV